MGQNAMRDNLPDSEVNDAKQVATLLMRMGRLGLRSAVPVHMISERNPAVDRDGFW